MKKKILYLIAAAISITVMAAGCAAKVQNDAVSETAAKEEAEKASGTGLTLYEGQSSVAETVDKLEQELIARDIPLFAKFDHAANAKEVGLELRPTTVLVFGSPKIGTGLMQENQSISYELPLRISVWEDENGRTQIGFVRVKDMAVSYGLEKNEAVEKMDGLLDTLAKAAANL